MKNDITPKDIVAEAVLAPSDTPLSLARVYARQFLYWMLTFATMRIFR